jgi:small-conductance mechanosensitive channel
MRQRRISFKLGLVYNTSTEQLTKVPDLITEIINNTENVTCDRAHFSGYGDYSLDFEFVYFVDTNDYNIYMNAQQQINLKIKSEFAKHNIEFAYPTQISYFNNFPGDVNHRNEQQAVDISS